MPSTVAAFGQIGQIASRRAVHAALRWLHLHEAQIMRWQTECVAIPAPPFGEAARAAWMAERFSELGLTGVHLDAAGNALGSIGSGPVDAEKRDAAERTSVVLVSAHLDTVFPEATPVQPALEGDRLHAPGACDNGAGLAALLALAAALRYAAIEPPCQIVFAGNVGEEGEGDLRGMRHIYDEAPWRERIAAHLVLDGAGHTVAVTGALGSRRFEAVFSGAGGHSWTDAARPNPVIALADAITRMAASHPTLVSGGVHPSARTTWNVGAVEGGSSVNTIPSRAIARFDLRSTDAEALLGLEVALYRAVEDAALAANRGAVSAHALTWELRPIGSRPVGALAPNARILALLQAVNRHLGLHTELRTASTDANIPLSRNVEAIALGAGGNGGGTHTTAEWFDARGRDLGLRRILLLVLALAECHAPDSTA